MILLGPGLMWEEHFKNSLQILNCINLKTNQGSSSSDINSQVYTLWVPIILDYIPFCSNWMNFTTFNWAHKTEIHIKKKEAQNSTLASTCQEYSQVRTKGYIIILKYFLTNWSDSLVKIM